MTIDSKQRGVVTGWVAPFAGTVRKYLGDGSLVWSKEFGGPLDTIGFAVGTDGGDNVYVAGRTSRNLETNAEFGSLAGFVQKRSPAGDVVYTRHIEQPPETRVSGIWVRTDGSFVVVGKTGGLLDGVKNLGAFDSFARGYDAAGTPTWTRQFGTAASDAALGVVGDAAGDVCVVGAEGSAGYVRKLTATGSEVWYVPVPQSTVNAVTASASGLFVAGTTKGSLDGASAGGQDVFVRKYDLTGNVQWTKQFGTASDDFGRSISMGTGGHLVVAGETGGDLVSPSLGFGDAFVLELDSAGAVVGQTQFGSASIDGAFGVVADDQGFAWAVGYSNQQAFITRFQPAPVQ